MASVYLRIYYIDVQSDLKLQYHHVAYDPAGTELRNMLFTILLYTFYGACQQTKQIQNFETNLKFIESNYRSVIDFTQCIIKSKWVRCTGYSFLTYLGNTPRVSLLPKLQGIKYYVKKRLMIVLLSLVHGIY